MVTIIGAGLSGLIAANILTRKHRLPVRIIEAQSYLPNNHAALLRFRSDAVAVATGIPFRKVTVSKGVWFQGEFVQPSIRLTNLYSYKVSGRYAARSIMNTEAGERWIAPEDLVARLADGLSIAYDSGMEFYDGGGPIISTIPMPALMKLVGWDIKQEFPSRKIWSARLNLDNVDLYQTVYLSALGDWPYRISITGNQAIIEGMSEPCPAPDYGRFVEDLFGVEGKCFRSFHGPKEQQYGKIMATNEDERRAFILAMTDKHQIYSLGRFACWRQILLDDIVQDVERIAGWIKERSNYSRRILL